METPTVNTIPRDEWEAGQHVKCDKCGRTCRHYIELSGSTYGRTCGLEKFGIEVDSSSSAQQEIRKIRRKSWHAEDRYEALKNFVEKKIEEDGRNWLDWTDNDEPICYITVMRKAHSVADLLDLEAKSDTDNTHAFLYAAKVYNEMEGADLPVSF